MLGGDERLSGVVKGGGWREMVGGGVRSWEVMGGDGMWWEVVGGGEVMAGDGRWWEVMGGGWR